MKNQFFADRRDFFKYDLLLELLEGTAFAGGLTLVPMLTPNDGGPDGRLTQYLCANRRQGPYQFLRACLSEGRRNILELRTLFAGFPKPYTPYRDDAYFRHETRDEYFEAIPDSALRGTLVFLDPDNGLEVASMRPGNGHKYVLWDEIRGLLYRMDRTCVLVVYQHLPREKREAYFSRMGDRFNDVLGVRDVACVSDNEIAVFVVAKDELRVRLTRNLLRGYAGRVGLGYPL